MRVCVFVQGHRMQMKPCSPPQHNQRPAKAPRRGLADRGETSPRSPRQPALKPRRTPLIAPAAARATQAGRRLPGVRDRRRQRPLQRQLATARHSAIIHTRKYHTRQQHCQMPIHHVLLYAHTHVLYALTCARTRVCVCVCVCVYACVQSGLGGFPAARLPLPLHRQAHSAPARAARAWQSLPARAARNRPARLAARSTPSTPRPPLAYATTAAAV